MMLRLIAGSAVAVLLLGAAGADAAGLDSLTGTWLPGGEVVAEGEIDPDGLAAGMVEIRPSGSDFRIRMPQVAGDAIEMRDLDFRATQRSGVFRCTQSGDPLAGNHLQWARLADGGGAGLVLYDFSVARDGDFHQVLYRLAADDGTLRLRIERHTPHGLLGAAEMSLQRR